MPDVVSNEITTKDGAGPATPQVCPVCGEAAIEARRCPACATAHHPECWDYNQGCARYGCAHAPTWRSLPDTGREEERPAGKILLSHMAFGSYDGIYFVPWLAASLTVFFELVGLLGPLLGYAWAAWGLAAMCLSILWIAITAERYYLDLDQRAVTRAKVVMGQDFVEWRVLPLAWVRRLALVPTGGAEDREDGSRRWVLATVDREDRLLPLAPPMLQGSPQFLRARSLLAKLRANNVFPVEIPAPARVGASEEVLRILGPVEEPDPGEPELRVLEDGTPVPAAEG